MAKVWDPNHPQFIYDKDDDGNIYLNGVEIEPDMWFSDLVEYEENENG